MPDCAPAGRGVQGRPVALTPPSPEGTWVSKGGRACSTPSSPGPGSSRPRSRSGSSAWSGPRAPLETGLSFAQGDRERGRESNQLRMWRFVNRGPQLAPTHIHTQAPAALATGALIFTANVRVRDSVIWLPERNPLQTHPRPSAAGGTPLGSGVTVGSSRRGPRLSPARAQGPRRKLAPPMGPIASNADEPPSPSQHRVRLGPPRRVGTA